MGTWVASLFTNTFALAPRATRQVASIFAVETISDWLNLAYARMKELAK